MNKFRATLATFACTAALGLSAALTAAAGAEVSGWKYEIEVIELPAPPKLAAPQAGPRAPHASKEMDRTSTPLAQSATIGPAPSLSKKRSLKLK